MTSDELPPVQEHSWPGPDRYTLRAMIELDLALDTDVTIVHAHAVMSDGVTRAFGARWYDWLTEALAAEGRDPDDLTVVLTDDALAERMLQHVRDRMREDDEAPDPPSEEFGWYAYGPDDPSGSRESFRRAVKRCKRNARHALLAPRRPRVAGPREPR